MIKNSPGCRRNFRVKMWGTSSPDDELTGDFGNVIEATQIGGRRLVRLIAGNLSPGNFRLLQHNPPESGQNSRSLGMSGSCQKRTRAQRSPHCFWTAYLVLRASSRAFAVALDEGGFWPVISNPSVTIFPPQGDSTDDLRSV